MGKTTKYCKRCGYERPIEDFPIHKAGKRGTARRFLCKEHWDEYCLEQRGKHIQSRRTYDKERYWADPERNRTRVKEQGQQLRLQVLQHYGGEYPTCSCCGESAIEFLCLDHIDGGGNQHRKAVGSGVKFIRWVIKNGYPNGFRILCHNCNSSLAYYGYCPHQKNKTRPV